MVYRGGTGGTGSDNLFQQPRDVVAALSYGSASGSSYVSDLETPADSSTGEKRRSAARQPVATTSQRRRSQSDRSLRKRRLSLQGCIEALTAVREMADDPISQDNARTKVKYHLSMLWDLANDGQSEAFEEMIAVLKVALHGDHKNLSEQQLSAIESVVKQMLDDPEVDDQIANDLTEELIKGGVDVFREIE